LKLSDVSDHAKDDAATATYRAMGETHADARAPATIGAPPVRPGDARVPDLLSLPLREVVKTLVGLGLTPVVEGSGRLTRQEPAAGTVLPKGSSVRLVFEPAS
jgi:cell division protein FtsI (penicillin-binding protein 3)